MPEISIIVRTKNEESWISHCLGMLYKQNFQDFEVILVDNNSSDHTVEIAKRFSIKTVLLIDKFLPGKALNDGIRASKGRYIVCLSAHCVPKDIYWLSNLRKNFIEDSNIAGVYGRQLPVSFTEAADKRDLLIVFGRDRRVQVKDYFFHNANSMVSREIWEKFPFDEEVTNIEDRVWGKEVTEAGYNIIYDPDAAVFHHHGLHQNNNSERVKGVVSIIESVDDDLCNKLPESLHPSNSNIAAVLPVLGEAKNISGVNLLERSIHEFKASQFIDTVYVLSENKGVHKLSKFNDIVIINRPEKLMNSDRSLEEVLQYALEQIEKLGDHPESILYVNYLMPFRQPGLVDELIYDAQYKGLDTVFPGFIDYGNFWREKNGSFIQIGDALKPRIFKHPLYRALYGSGCLSSAKFIRAGKLIGDRVGIVPIKNMLYSLRYDEETPLEVLENLIKLDQKGINNDELPRY